MNEILKKHLEEARKNGSTSVAIEMFTQNGEFMKNFSANSYLMALSEINTQTARIAELEAQNKRLVEIVDRLCWSIENGDFPESSYWEMYAENARALLAELTA